MASENVLLPTMVVLATLAALLYIALGLRLGKRKVAPEASLANHAWQAWWILLAASTLIGTVLTTLVASFGTYTVEMGMTVMVVNLAIIFGALWGLSYYLAYLVTGRFRLWIPIAWFYGLSVVAWIYTIFSADPVGTQIQDGTAALTYASALEDQPMYMTLLLALLLPVLAIATTYAYLGFKADDRTVRFRIILVSFSLVLWFGTSLIASLAGLSDYENWPIISRLISLGAAALIYLAHFPPSAMVKRLGLRPVDEN